MGWFIAVVGAIQQQQEETQGLRSGTVVRRNTRCAPAARPLHTGQCGAHTITPAVAAVTTVATRTLDVVLAGGVFARGALSEQVLQYRVRLVGMLHPMMCYVFVFVCCLRDDGTEIRFWLQVAQGLMSQSGPEVDVFQPAIAAPSCLADEMVRPDGWMDG